MRREEGGPGQSELKGKLGELFDENISSLYLSQQWGGEAIQNMEFLRDGQGFIDELNDLRNEGWTVVCLEGPWHAGQRNDVFREPLGPHVHCFPGDGECLNPL